MAGAGVSKRTADDADLSGNRNIHRRKRLRCTIGGKEITHPLIDRLYPKVQTLRKYLIARLPSSSRLRRKKIANLGFDNAADATTPESDIKIQLCHLLDTTLVASEKDGDRRLKNERDTRWEEWTAFSQNADESHVTLSDGHSNPHYSQSEIVDFVIWLLFSREQAAGKWPKHLLCDGYRKNVTRGAAGAIPGIFSLYPNQHVHMLKEAPWPQLLMLLGKAGERIMIDLLADCSVFTSVKAGHGNLLQLSGISISELDFKLPGSHEPQQPKQDEPAAQAAVKSSEIIFARARMMYAKAGLNAQGQVQFGLRHIHVLNRCQWKGASVGPGAGVDNHEKQAQDTKKVMMYIFPRQFGMHNVFTSVVDHTRTAQKLQDYTLREDEIKELLKSRAAAEGIESIKMPKRLRGDPTTLTERLRILHTRCAYRELLGHYCPTALDTISRRQSRRRPVPASTAHEQMAASSATQGPCRYAVPRPSDAKRKPAGKDRRRLRALPMAQPTIQFDSLTDLATPVHAVSAFCQAVLARIIPREFWSGDALELRNLDLVMKKIDHFVRLRRFESMSLSELREGFKVADMTWLIPPQLRGRKSSVSDTQKRLEILDEFLYYVFDSILIPLVRSNFYVTESNTHRNKLFFFRHDIWRHIAEPAMTALRVNMFEEVKLDEAMRILASRKLGFSQIRLLPKGTSVRPITNLRRRSVAIGNKKVLQPSINSVLGPLHAVLVFEKKRDPALLGASLFSVAGIYDRLKSFRAKLGPDIPRLYFVKVDVKSAFDTIPQDAVLRLMHAVISLQQYKTSRHAEFKAGTKRLIRRWQTTAARGDDKALFVNHVEQHLGRGKKNTVFIDSVMQKKHSAESLAALLTSHIEQNLIKVGKKYYRQKQGIPQGSVVSSTLCNYFYGDLERRHLGFLDSDECLLLRLIDDFLLITTDGAKARRFANVMHGGIPDYGVAVNPTKTVVNFAMDFDGRPVASVGDDEKFPYCGTLINCKTLSISKSREHAKDNDMRNTLTIEFGRVPGQSFRRKVLDAFKIQSHVMFYDTELNSPAVVYTNLYEAFAETASKMWAYTRGLPTKQQPSSTMVIDTILKLVDVAHYLLTSKTRKAKHPGYVCVVGKYQIKWLAVHAIRETLARRQTKYADVVAWLGRVACQLALKKCVRDLEWAAPTGTR